MASCGSSVNPTHRRRARKRPRQPLRNVLEVPEACDVIAIDEVRHPLAR